MKRYQYRASDLLKIDKAFLHTGADQLHFQPGGYMAYYNGRYLHSAPGYKTPIIFENDHESSRNSN